MERSSQEEQENHKANVVSTAKQQMVESTSEEEREWQNQMDETLYVSQHFDSSADEFTDTVFNLSVHHLIKLLPTTKKSLQQLVLTDKNPDDSKFTTGAEAEIQSGLNDFVKAFYSALQHDTDVLRLYLEKYIINIPEGVVLPTDVVQLRYKELVSALQAEGEEQGKKYTENNMADSLTVEADELREKLRQRKIQRLNLEYSVGRADAVIRKLEALERVLSELDSGFPGSIRDYVLKNIALVSDIPNGVKK